MHIIQCAQASLNRPYSGLSSPEIRQLIQQAYPTLRNQLETAYVTLINLHREDPAAAEKARFLLQRMLCRAKDLSEWHRDLERKPILTEADRKRELMDQEHEASLKRVSLEKRALEAFLHAVKTVPPAEAPDAIERTFQRLAEELEQEARQKAQKLKRDPLAWFRALARG